MKLAFAILFTVAAGFTARLASAQPLGSGFTFQGSLADGGAPASGPHDFVFTLFDAANGGSPVSSILCGDDVPIANGLFTIELDFGAMYNGQRRWLEIQVRADPSSSTPCSTTTGFTTLSPRQELTPTPHARFAVSTPWSGITDKPAGFADGTDDGFTAAGTGLSASGSAVGLNLGYTDLRYLQSTTAQLNGDAIGLIGSVNVVGLRGVPISAASPQNNQVLTYSGGIWAPMNVPYPSAGNALIYNPGGAGSYAVDLVALDARYLNQNIALLGDVTGLSSNNTVTRLQGRAVAATAPATNQVLKWNGVQWGPASDSDTVYSAGSGLTLTGSQFAVNFTTMSASYVDEAQAAGGDVSGTFSSLTVTRLQGRAVNSAAPAVDDVLRWSGVSWVPDAETEYTASAGLGLTSQNAFFILPDGVTSTLLASDAQSLFKVSGGNMRVTSGNVGVGSGTPLEKLHVFGNLTVTGTIATATGITVPNTTRHWSGAAQDWALPPNATATNISFGSNGWTGQDSFTTFTMEQPIHLPQGAAVSALEFYAFDNNGNDFTIQLLACPSGGGAPTAVASVNSSSSAAGVRTFSGIASAVIDNTANAYRLRASWPTGSQPLNMRLHGVHVSYIVSSPLP